MTGILNPKIKTIKAFQTFFRIATSLGLIISHQFLFNYRHIICDEVLNEIYRDQDG